MYTISQAARRTGITVPVLRAWERRYGIVAPNRTPSGYRLYDDAAIERLNTMQRLVATGWSPSAAAAAIVGGTAPAHRGPSLPKAPERETTDDLVDPFVRAAARLDAQALEAILDEMFARGTFERIAETYLLPSLEAIGAAWADGRVDVGGEHLASHAVLRRLGAAFAAAGGGADEAGPVLVGLPSGSRHEFGALVFAIVARRARIPVLYLGADLPPDHWIVSAIRADARGAAIGAVTSADLRPARAVANALRAARPDLLVAFGGRHQPPDPAAGGAPPGDPAILHLPQGLADAVETLREALDAHPRRVR